MSGAVLIARGVSVRFGGLTAVSDMSLDVQRGQILGLIGPNGAGKTTLFNALTGHQLVDAGTVELLGIDITTVPAHMRARMGMARTFQLGGLIPELTALENVALGLDHYARTGKGKIPRGETRTAATSYLDRFGLGRVADELVAGLPAGTKREIEVARALASSASLLLLDEPGAGLTAAERQRLSAMVRDIAQTGTAFIITDHSTDLVFSVSDEVVVMSFGQLVRRGEPDAIRRDPAVMEAYLGRSAVNVDGVN